MYLKGWFLRSFLVQKQWINHCLVTIFFLIIDLAFFPPLILMAMQIENFCKIREWYLFKTEHQLISVEWSVIDSVIFFFNLSTGPNGPGWSPEKNWFISFYGAISNLLFMIHQRKWNRFKTTNYKWLWAS